MTVMHDTLNYPGGKPARSQDVHIVKLAPKEDDEATITSSEVTVVAVAVKRTNLNGRLEVDLEPTSQLNPSGTVYRARWWDNAELHYSRIFEVPDSGPAWIGAHLKKAPTALRERLNLDPAGPWTQPTEFLKTQLVEHNGGSFLAKVDHTSSPDTEPGVDGNDWRTVWLQVAAKGDKGEDGLDGEDGELTGTAGGDLQGTYPDPTLSDAKQAELDGKQDTSQKDQAGGYAGLDGSGKIQGSAVPSIGLSEYLGDVADESAMLALSGQSGDWCKRTDENRFYILTTTGGSSTADWVAMPTPGEAIVQGEAAGGDLGGTYPSPTLSAAKQAELDAKAEDVDVVHNSDFDGKGDLQVGTGPDAYSRLGPGTDGQVLKTNSALAEGLEWGDESGSGSDLELLLDAKGDLLAGSGPDTAARVPAGAVGEFPVRNDTPAGGIVWVREAHINPWDPRWGLVFDGATDDSPALQAMHDALPADGGKILWPEGHGFLASKLVFDKPLTVEGAGTGVFATLAATLLTVAAGVTGIELAVGGQKQRLQDFYLQSQSSASGTDDGIDVKAPRGILDNITTEGFGRRGFSADTAVSGNANLSQWRSLRAYKNKSHGFYTVGVDSNVISLITPDAQENGGWGYFNDAPCNMFDNPHATLNTDGAYYDDNSSTLYLNPYSEGGTGDNVHFDTGSRAIRWIEGHFSAPTITDDGTNNVILRDGAWGDPTGRNTRFRHYGYLELLRAASQLNSTVLRIFNGSEEFPRVQYIGTGEMRWSDGSVSPDTTLRRAAPGIFYVTNAFRMPERSDPPAPGANDGIVYMRDNGSGKTQLCVRFNSGAVQVIATQP